MQFNESVEVKTLPPAAELENMGPVEIDEEKIDRVLVLLHDADPTSDGSTDPQELPMLENQANAMGPKIDAELEGN